MSDRSITIGDYTVLILVPGRKCLYQGDRRVVIESASGECVAHDLEENVLADNDRLPADLDRKALLDWLARLSTVEL